MSYVEAPRLVEYAGSEGPGRWIKTSDSGRVTLPTAYDLFKLGNDTLEIARILGISEATALRRLSNERSRAKGLPGPYEAVA